MIKNLVKSKIVNVKRFVKQLIAQVFFFGKTPLDPTFSSQVGYLTYTDPYKPQLKNFLIRAN